MPSKILEVVVERPGGQEDTYQVLPKTRVNFERQWKTPLGYFVQEPYDERLYWLAWDAEKVAGRVVKPFDSWLDEIVAVSIKEEPAPFTEGATPGS